MTPATVQPVAARRFATDVVVSQFVLRVATETVVVGATTSVISSGTAARVGDQILFTSGTLSGQTFTVVNQLSTTYTLGQEASSAPSGGDSFYVLRYRAPEVSSTGGSIVDTELSDATLLADGDPIPTCGKVGAVVMAKNTSGTLDIAKLAKAHDLDTDAGVEYGTGVNLRFSGSGGSTEALKTIDQAGFVTIANALVPAKYDYISLAYTGSNLTTVVFKTGGAAGSTQATLTLAYTGSQLDSVTKT